MPAQATSDPFDAAHAAQSNGDYTTAIRLYGEALHSGGLGPANQARVYRSRGSAHAAIGLFEKAAADYNDAVRIDPGEVQAIVGRATVQFLLGRFTAAFVDFEAAQKMEPRAPYISLWLEMTRLRLKKDDLGVFRANAALHQPSKWPYPIIEAFLQRCEPSDLLVFTGEPGDPRGRANVARQPFSWARFSCTPSNSLALRTGSTRPRRGVHILLWNTSQPAPNYRYWLIAQRRHSDQVQATAPRPTSLRAPAPGPNMSAKLLRKGTLINVDGVELGRYRVVGIGAQPSDVHGDFVVAPSAENCNAASCP